MIPNRMQQSDSVILFECGFLGTCQTFLSQTIIIGNKKNVELLMLVELHAFDLIKANPSVRTALEF